MLYIIHIQCCSNSKLSQLTTRWQHHPAHTNTQGVSAAFTNLPQLWICNNCLRITVNIPFNLQITSSSEINHSWTLASSPVRNKVQVRKVACLHSFDANPSNDTGYIKCILKEPNLSTGTQRAVSVHRLYLCGA